MSASRGCLVFTNLLTFLVSFPVVASALLIRYYGRTNCSGYVQGPVLTIGVLLLAVSLMGMIGACCRLTAVLSMYLCVMFVVVTMLLGFSLATATILPMSSPTDGPREGLPLLYQYPSLLRNNFIDEHRWAGIKSCMAQTQICSGSQNSWAWSKSLSPVKVGCCNPPSNCGYDLMNSTLWDVARTNMPMNSEFNDCRTWNSEPHALCYDCDSCKAGFLARIRNAWMRITIAVNFLIAYLIINFMIGCCAFRSSGVIAERRHGDHS